MIFTRENQRIIIFIIFTVIVGSSIALVKYRRPDLFMGKPEYIADSKIKQKEKIAIENKEDIQTQQKTSIPSAEKISATGTHNELIDINVATAEQLQQLPRIGPVLAKRIIEYRKLYSRFVSKEQLMEVRGIGEKTFDKLKDKVVVKE